MSSIADIQRTTAAHFGLSREELLKPDRSRRYAWPRQLAMALAHENGHSLTKVGRHFGRHHTSVLHAVKRVSFHVAIVREVEAIRADLARVGEEA